MEWKKILFYVINILDYCVYLAKFLWEVALLVWALALIYLWYEKIWKAIKPESSTPFSKVIIWLLVIIFAYAIIKLIWSAFISEDMLDFYVKIWFKIIKDYE